MWVTQPKEILKWSGKFCFFTVNVIGTLETYYTFSFVTEFMRTIVGYQSDNIDKLVMFFFWPAYILGTSLTVFYYAGEQQPFEQ